MKQFLNTLLIAKYGYNNWNSLTTSQRKKARIALAKMLLRQTSMEVMLRANT